MLNGDAGLDEGSPQAVLDDMACLMLDGYQVSGTQILLYFSISVMF